MWGSTPRVAAAGAVLVFLFGVLGLLVAGGPAALTGPSTAGDPTATPTLTPVALADGTSDRTGLPPGVTADGLESAPDLKSDNRNLRE